MAWSISRVSCFIAMMVGAVSGLAFGGSERFEGLISLAGQGHHLFVATELEIKILDVSAPEKPLQVGSIPRVHKISGVFANGEKLSVIDNLKAPNQSKTTYVSLIRFFDTSDPVHPKFQGQLEIPKSEASQVSFSDKYAYLLYMDDPAANTEVAESVVQVIDISNPTSPTPKGKWHWSGSGQEIVAANQYVYLLKSRVESAAKDEWEPYDLYSLEILDAKNPNRLRVLSNRDLGAESPAGLFVEGKKAFVGMENDVQQFDVSNPTSITMQAKIPNLTNTDANAKANLFIAYKRLNPEISGVAMLGHHMFVIAQESLQVVDIGNPEKPVTVYPKESIE